MDTKNVLKLNFDGACDNNKYPPMMGVGVAVHVDGKEKKDLHRFFNGGIGTSNIAEYFGMITAVEIAIAYLKENKGEIREVVIVGDSMLIIKQVQGEWDAKKPHLKLLLKKVKELLSKPCFNRVKVTLTWMSRKHNTLADELSKQGLTTWFGPSEFIEGIDLNATVDEIMAKKNKK